MVDSTTNESETDDPLEHADVGEIERVQETKELSVVDMAPRECFGSDRVAIDDVEAADVELIETERGQRIKLEYDVRMMKQLPDRWDYCREPRTEQEEAEEKKRKRIFQAANIASILIPSAIVVAVATVVTNRAMSEMTINGERAATSGDAVLLSAVALFALISVIAIGVLTRRIPTLSRGRF